MLIGQDQQQLRDISWEAYSELPPHQKAPYLNNGRRPYHVLLAQQFDRETLDEIGTLATSIRRIAKSKNGMHFLQDLLAHKRAMLYFSQPSSRTFLSFYAACQIIGLHPAEVRDASTSSEVKGESPEDTLRTFSSYFDVLVMRTPMPGFSERIAWLLSNTERPVPIINAGSGKDQHPSQALLDIYTLQRSFENLGGIENKNIVFVGDLARGRTVRSLSCLLTLYPGVKQYFVAPERLQVQDDVRKQLDATNTDYEVTQDFERIIPDADAIYMTRLQDEWDTDKGGEKNSENCGYFLTPEHLSKMKHTAVIMHPLPRRNEIDTRIDADPRAVYWRQVRNGMWIRVALMATIFGKVGDEILNYYELNMS